MHWINRSWLLFGEVVVWWSCFFLFFLGVVCSCLVLFLVNFRSRFLIHLRNKYSGTTTPPALPPVVEKTSQVNVKLNPHPLSPLWPDSSNKTGYGMLGPYDAWAWQTDPVQRWVRWTNSRVSRWWLDVNGGGFFIAKLAMHLPNERL